MKTFEEFREEVFEFAKQLNYDITFVDELVEEVQLNHCTILQYPSIVVSKHFDGAFCTVRSSLGQGFTATSKQIPMCVPQVRRLVSWIAAINSSNADMFVLRGVEHKLTQK